MRILSHLALVATTLLAGPALADSLPMNHVLVISVDGMHQSDLAYYVAQHPTSNFAKLVNGGLSYTNALTTAPSDSFPGMIAQFTGATPITTGFYYDDSYDRSLYAPGSGCAGNPGTETNFAENLDKSLNDYTGGGTVGQPLTQIDATQLPLMLNGDGSCTPVYPHQILRVNTVFNVLHDLGLRTAWTDKHPSYEVLTGPTGDGIDDLYTPEINANNILGGSGDNTKSFYAVQAYDALKVQSVLNEEAGLDSTGKSNVGVPAIMGMNFQAVSVGQKLKSSKDAVDKGLLGGYVDVGGAQVPGNALSLEFDWVDAQIGKFLAALPAKTTVILSAKHGQAPIDLSQLTKIDDGAWFPATPGFSNGGVNDGFEIADDGLLLWLSPAKQASQTFRAQNYLKSIEGIGKSGLAAIYRGARAPFKFGDPATDPRAPDFVGVTQVGVVYTTSGSKISEHGGYSLQDRNVPLVVYGYGLLKKSVGKSKPNKVMTTQIAPTIMHLFNLPTTALDGVAQENTQVLPCVFR